jgi:hypothetical protein
MFGITRGIRCVFSGKFKGDETVWEILTAALQEKSVDVGVLRICDEENGLDGDIGIERNVFVIGGRIRGRDEQGWDAIKMLLTTKRGTFQYLDLRNRFPHGLDCGLKIRLTDLIAAWPHLPDSAEKLKCGRESLNRIKAYSDSQNLPIQPGKNKSVNNKFVSNGSENSESTLGGLPNKLLGKLARIFEHKAQETSVRAVLDPNRR